MKYRRYTYIYDIIGNTVIQILVLVHLTDHTICRCVGDVDSTRLCEVVIRTGADIAVDSLCFFVEDSYGRGEIDGSPLSETSGRNAVCRHSRVAGGGRLEGERCRHRLDVLDMSRRQWNRLQILVKNLAGTRLHVMCIMAGICSSRLPFVG